MRGPALDRVVSIAGCAIAGGAASTVLRHVGLLGVLLGAIVGAALGFLAPSAKPSTAPSPPTFERFSLLATLLFFVPVFTMTIVPGADMTMHVALGRAIADGGRELNPAWGDIAVIAYPRGLSAWVALISVVTGFTKAGLVAAAFAYAVYAVSLRAFLRDVLEVPFPSLVAVLVLLASKSPQGFFSWGGNPTALALALGLLAAATLASSAERAPVRAGLVVAVLLVGALFCHPIGGFAGLIVVGISALVRLFVAPAALRAPLFRSLAIATGLAFAVSGAVMLVLKRGGPALSPYELAWIDEFVTREENVLRGPRWAFPITVWGAAFEHLGAPWIGLYVVAIGAELRTTAGRTRALRSILAVVALGALFAFGPRVPAIGFLLYPGRFLPLLAIAMAPPMGFSLEGFAATRPRLAWIPATMALAIGIGVHVDMVQTAKPMATANDLAAIRCLDEKAPKTAVIEGWYGDATQWIPSLTGRKVTRPHVHCTLFDEVRASLAGSRATYRFVGERHRYEEPRELLDTPLPDPPPVAPLCRVGGAAVYPL